MSELQLSSADKRALKEINERAGKLTRRDVVDAARPPESPLHKHFEWDDTKAAEQWRLDQAGKLIVRARVIFEPAPRDQVRARPAARMPPIPTQRYSPPLRAVPPANDDGKLVAAAIEELKSLREKYSGLRPLGALFMEIERLANPRAIGTNVVAEAAALALRLEASCGLDRKTAVARASVAFNVGSFDVLQAVRKVG